MGTIVYTPTRRRLLTFMATKYYLDQLGLPKTDPTRWRLRVSDLGRQTWHYLSEEDAKAEPQLTVAQHALETADFPTPEATGNNGDPWEACKLGALFFELLQDEQGTFPCMYQGPQFMTIGYVAACYYCGIEIPEPFRVEMIRYIVNTSHPVDGGWGLHTVDKLTCFGTTMNYVCLRLLGLEPDHPVMVKARRTLHRLGGALYVPHWGKAWLLVLNLYRWEGVNPMPPELYLLPENLPLYPGNWWVHTRAIYLPLGLIVANRLQTAETDLIRQIRLEIYTKKYDSIDFSKHRNLVCGVDLYYPHTTFLNIANWALDKYEQYRPQFMRNIVNNRVYDLLVKDYKNTEWLLIAPVSYAFSLIITHWREGPKLENFIKLQDRLNDVAYVTSQGMCVMGTNGVQVWDALFMIQYWFMLGLAELPQYQPMVRKAYMFLVRLQFTTNCEPGSLRDIRNGAWPFSTKEQGYTVSDCTAEAVKSIIMVRNSPVFADIHDAISDQRLYDAIEVLMLLQNRGSYEFGSFSTYEKIRATPLLEALNPAEVFNNIMVEYPYVECTDSLVLGLTYFHKFYPKYKSDLLRFAIDDAIAFIVKAQQDDGSWYGAWGVCYTYAGMFALEALDTVNRHYDNDAVVMKGCDFLISKQLPDGGWLELMKGCETHSYINSERSLVVQTAWALIGLVLARYPDREPLDRAAKLLMDRQLPTGEWKFEDIEGVFNHLCAIEYPSYRFLFPIKALGLYNKAWKDKN